MEISFTQQEALEFEKTGFNLDDLRVDLFKDEDIRKWIEDIKLGKTDADEFIIRYN